MIEMPEWIRQTYICLLKNGEKATDFIVAQTMNRALQKSGKNILVRKSDVYRSGKQNDDRNHLQEFIDKLNE